MAFPKQNPAATHAAELRKFRPPSRVDFSRNANRPRHPLKKLTRLQSAHPIRFAAWCLLTSAVSVHAGFVTWSTPHTIVNNSDISTTGTLVVAHNLGAPGNSSATVNGVTFTPFGTNGPVNILGNVKLSAAANILGDNINFGEIVMPFSDLTLPYQTLLQSGSFTSGLFPPPEITLTLSGLSMGTQYQFQWWANQSGFFSFDPNPPPGIPTTTATAGGVVSLDRTGFDPGSLGQFAIGTFTADATSQAITFSGSDTKTLLSAFQLRALPATAIPEPGSCLFALALSGVALRSMSSRRRTV